MVVTAVTVFLFLLLIIVLNHFDIPYFLESLFILKKKTSKNKAQNSRKSHIQNFAPKDYRPH